MANSIKLIVYPVKDVEKATEFYSTFLGTEPYVEGEYYVGYKLGDLEVGLDPNSTVGPIAYTDTSDIKATVQELVEAGATILQDPKDVGGGLLVAQVKDIDGNVIGLRQA